MRILLFGTGAAFARYVQWFQNKDIIGVIDNDTCKQGREICGWKVFSPLQASNLCFDYIYILSIHWEEMKEQLLQLGIEEEKVLTFRDIRLGGYFKSKPQKKFQGLKRKENGSALKCALLAFDSLRTGANMALFYAASILREMDFEPVVISAFDGPMRKAYQEEGIDVLIDPNLQISNYNEIQYWHDFAFIIANTVDFILLLKDADIDRPVLWWLHEPRKLYLGYTAKDFRTLSLDKISAYAVSPIASKAILTFTGSRKPKLLPLGIPDSLQVNLGTPEGINCIFAFIGTISHIKGVDILLQAIKKLKPALRERSRFLIIGNSHSDFANYWKKWSEDQRLNQVEFINELPHQEVLEKYKSIDVLICPAREESLSITSLEAMVHSLPCIISDGAGIAEFLLDKENALIFSSGSVCDLTEKISFMIINKEARIQMGRRARQVYEEYFSMMAFKNRLYLAIKELLR